MQPSPPPTPEPKPRSFGWPILLNLLLLVVAAVQGGTDLLPFVIAGLVVVNVVAAVIMGLSKQMHYVPAFLLAGLVVLLVGLGACFLLVASH